MSPLHLSLAVLCMVFSSIILLLLWKRNQEGRSRAGDVGSDEGSSSDDAREDQGTQSLIAHTGRIAGHQRLTRRRAEKIEEKKRRRHIHEALQEERRRRIVREEEETIAKEIEEEAEIREARERAEEVLLEKRRREEQEYQQWFGSMSTDEKGLNITEKPQEEIEAEQAQFVADLLMNKIVLLDELAAKHSSPIDAVVQKIEQLQKEGLVCGIFDDRGKYISITTDEYRGFARFINQRGRVSIQEVLAESSRLIKWDQKEDTSELGGCTRVSSSPGTLGFSIG